MAGILPTGKNDNVYYGGIAPQKPRKKPRKPYILGGAIQVPDSKPSTIKYPISQPLAGLIAPPQKPVKPIDPEKLQKILDKLQELLKQDEVKKYPKAG